MRTYSGFIPDTEKNAPSFDKFSAKVAVKDSLDSVIIPEYTPISDQGNYPSCTAQVVCDITEALIGLEDPSKVVQLSRMAAWWHARRQEGHSQNVCGVRLSSTFRAATEVGLCPENLWQYEVPDGFSEHDWAVKKPNLQAEESMFDNKITGFVQIYEVGDSLLDAVDYALDASHPVGYGTGINKAFSNYDGSDPDFVAYPSDQIEGRHAIAIFGRRRRQGRRQYFIRNSWGISYGFNGHIWVDQDYLTWAEASSFTVGTRAVEILV